MNPIVSRILSAMLFCLGLFGAATAMAEDVLSAKAKQHFDAGLAYVDEPNGPKHEEAYYEFKLAYADSPTYLILANIGYCAFYLERDGEAIEAYEGYLAKATPQDIPAKKRARMELDIQTLKASLVKVTYTTTPKALTIIDERIPSKGSPIKNRYELTTGTLGLGIHPGHHRITASAEGYEPQVWEVEAGPTTTHAHEFNLRPRAEGPVEGKPTSSMNSVAATETGSRDAPDRPSRTPVYIGLAATGLLTATATVTGLMELSKQREFDDAKQRGDRPAAQSAADTGKTLALACDVSIGAAILGAGITTYLFVAGSRKATEPPTSQASINLAPVVSRGNIGVSLSSRF